MSKRTFAVILTLLCSFCIGQALAGGIVLQRTRVIYDASRKEAALPVANKGAETPYLLQSWVDNIDGKSRAPFIITPPLFRLEAGDDSSLRIIKTADNLPENKESLFYINVRAIPAKKKSDDVNANELTLVFKTRIKMFYGKVTFPASAVTGGVWHPCAISLTQARSSLSGPDVRTTS